MRDDSFNLVILRLAFGTLRHLVTTGLSGDDQMTIEQVEQLEAEYLKLVREENEAIERIAAKFREEMGRNREKSEPQVVHGVVVEKTIERRDMHQLTRGVKIREFSREVTPDYLFE